MREARLSKTPEGRLQLKAEYYALLRKRAAERDGIDPMAKYDHATKAGVPYDAISTLKGKPDDTDALRAAERFCNDGAARTLVLLGDKGVGKTVAAAHVVVRVCENWQWNNQATGQDTRPVYWVEGPTLTRISSFADADKEQIALYRGCRLLVLEELGRETTKHGVDLVTEILIHRHEHKRRTVVTSNQGWDAFRERYGAAVADRFKSHGIIPNLATNKSQRTRRVGT